MSKYFMRDTKHTAFERMMMEVPKHHVGPLRRKKPRDREKKALPPQKVGERK